MHRALNHFGYKVVPTNTTQEATVALKIAFGIDLPADRYYHCHKGWKLLSGLKNTNNATLHLNKEGCVAICIAPFVFEINTWEEIFILHEIFVNGIYNLQLREEFLLIDIGMNVGFSSIYFSRLNECKRIIAFEPFAETVIAAQKNMALNPASINKINIHNFGVGYPARTIDVDYSFQYKGSVGINGVAAYAQNTSAPVKATLCIADVAIVLEPYLTEATGKKVIKIDCEGAEYEIVERLAQTGLLQQFDVLMIEWHIKGPAALKSILSKAGFTQLSFNEYSSTIGMLYAFKNN